MINDNPTDEPNVKEENGLVDYIDLRIAKGHGKKLITLIEGLPSNIDTKKIVKVLSKLLACAGTIIEKNVLMFQGDHRNAIRDWIIKEQIAEKERIKIHG